MFESEVLVCKGAGAVDGSTACAIAVQEVAALDHKVSDLSAMRVRSRPRSLTASPEWSCKRGNTYNTVELAPFVALRSSLSVLRLARAKLAEVFGRFGGDVGEELHFDAAERFAWISIISGQRVRGFD